MTINTLIIHNDARYYAAHDIGTFYRMNKGALEFQPMLEDQYALPNPNEWNDVEEDLVGEEPVVYESQKMTLSEVYKIVRAELE